MAGAGRALTGDTFPTPATFRSDAAEKTAGELLIDGAALIEEPGRIEEAVSIAGALTKGESGRWAGERMESAAAARTAAISRSTKKIISRPLA